jgi:hypothetical protein
VEYKFLNGQDWIFAEAVPLECGVDDGSGVLNRSYTAGDVNATVPIVCFSGCVDCTINPEIDITFQVNMANQIVDPAGVFIAGSFNGFNPTANEMTPSGAAIYSYTVTVPVNALVTYKFLNGGAWEVVPFECGQDDGFGGFNRYLQGGDVDVTIPLVCFNECADCDIAVLESNNAALRLFPNPSLDQVTLSGVIPGQLILIYAIDGQLIKTLRADSESQFIDLSQFASGVYTVQVGESFRKLIRE